MHDEENYRFVGKNIIIELTALENRALQLLIKNKNSIVTYEEFCCHLYHEKADKYLKINVQTTICRLKKKLKGEIEIRTRNRIGYILG